MKNAENLDAKELLEVPITLGHNIIPQNLFSLLTYSLDKKNGLGNFQSHFTRVISRCFIL